MGATLQDNMITIDFGNETKVKTPEVHQYDWGIKISFLDVADGNVVQFSNIYTETSIDRKIERSEVAIPPTLLESFSTINAYVRIVNENYEIITKEIEIPVKKVAKPSDVIPSDESNKPIVEQLQEQINSKQDKLIAGNNITIVDNVISATGGSGTGGTSDYNDLENKPKINGVELVGDVSLEDLGIEIPDIPENEIPEVNSKHNYKVDEIEDNRIDGKFVYDNFELGYTYRYDGEYSIFSLAGGILGTYINPIITVIGRYDAEDEVGQIIEVQSINTDLDATTNPAELIVADKYINVTTFNNNELGNADGTLSIMMLIESHDTSSGGSVELDNYYTKDETEDKIDEKIANALNGIALAEGVSF